MTQPQPDRFLTLLSFASEMVRTEEASIRAITRAMHSPYQSLQRFIESRTQLYELLTSMQNTIREEEELPALVPQIRINIPAGWEDPVPVVPSNQQITHSMLDIPETSEPGTCAICQDTIQHRPDGCSLRNCGHHFHDNCIMEWFSHSVRCPVCRNDIRESLSEPEE